MSENKNIYFVDDIPELKYLMTFKDDLIFEFLRFNRDWKQPEMKMVETVKYTVGDVTSFLSNPGAWKAQVFRYETSMGKNVYEKNHLERFFPTSFKMMNHYKGDLGIVMYSILEPNSVIGRHTGGENRTGELIRVHLPLIVPDGDIFFEVDGEEVTWEQPFAFDNQKVHSAHNYSNERRLVFLIDIKRSRLGLPPGKPYDPVSEKEAKPFVRK